MLMQISLLYYYYIINTIIDNFVIKIFSSKTLRYEER